MRMRFTRGIAAFLVLALSLGALAQAPAPSAPQRLTVAAYNVEWFLDVFDDPYTQDEVRPPKPRAAVEAICRAVRALDADVVALSELENEGVLREAAGLFLADMGYEYIAAGKTNSGVGQNLGVLSRRPIESLTSHRLLDLRLDGEPATWRFARDLWRVRVQATPSRTLDVYVVHFKSKRDSDGDRESARWRLAEATAARRIIARTLEADPQAWVALVGDLNDTPASATLEALLNGQAASPALLDVHAALPAEERVTYLLPPYRSTIDYILASPALARRLVPGSARVLHDESLAGASDHAPIVASFDLAD